MISDTVGFRVGDTVLFMNMGDYFVGTILRVDIGVMTDNNPTGEEFMLQCIDDRAAHWKDVAYHRLSNDLKLYCSTKFYMDINRLQTL